MFAMPRINNVYIQNVKKMHEAGEDYKCVQNMEADQDVKKTSAQRQQLVNLDYVENMAEAKDVHIQNVVKARQYHRCFASDMEADQDAFLKIVKRALNFNPNFAKVILDN